MPTDRSSLKKWVCTECWTLRHRAEFEESRSVVTPTDPATWRCAHCDAIGNFVDQTSGAFGGMVLDLMWEEYLAKIRAAGWDVLSSRCEASRHEACSGIAADQLRCDCECHGKASS